MLDENASESTCVLVVASNFAYSQFCLQHNEAH